MCENTLISGGRRIAMDALMDNVRRAASGFHDLGVGDGDTVAIFLRNDFAFFEAAYAATMLGAYAVPINWHLKAEEAGYIIRDCAARTRYVLSTRDVVLGRTAGYHDLSQLDRPLRSHGSRYEEMVPLLVSAPLSAEYRMRALGDPRNFDVFDFVCNGTSGETTR